VDSLWLDLDFKTPEPHAEPVPTGVVTIEHGESSAVLLTPETVHPGRRYPLVTVLHGAGRQDGLLVRACQGDPEKRQALFLIPRSVHPTWDLIAGANRPDLDFLQHAYDLIYRRYPIDPARQALLGYSDGASYALAIGLSNPQVFCAVMGWAAGFLAIDDRRLRATDRKPAVLLEYGTHDELFPFERVALPMRATLEGMGYSVEFRVDQGGRHWPSGSFHGEALDWFQSEPWRERS
jgi:phospholipase/carboxylesterase